MALTKETVVDRIEILEDGTLGIRRASYIVEDGVRISDARYHRAAYVPGADISAEPPRVRAIANIVWTAQVVAEYKAKVAANSLPR
jgi:hypothetical protein